MLKSNFSLKQLLSILFISIFLFSCSNNENSEEQVQNNNNGNKVETSTANDGKSNVYTTYNLPLPVEIYKFLRDKEYDFNINLLNSKGKKAKTFTDLSKAINLGFYSSDLAYCILFEQSTESVDYFSISIELAQELDITKGYNEQVLDRSYDNIENNDSLSIIAKQAYRKTCDYLEKNEKINILPFTIVGSWIESMYILTEYTKITKGKKLIYKEIYKQKVSLKNLIDYLHEVMNDSNAFIVNADIQEIIDSLKLLKKEFNDIKNENDLTSYDKQFEQINLLITKFRGKYI